MSAAAAEQESEREPWLMANGVHCHAIRLASIIRAAAREDAENEMHDHLLDASADLADALVQEAEELLAAMAAQRRAETK